VLTGAFCISIIINISSCSSPIRIIITIITLDRLRFGGVLAEKTNIILTIIITASPTRPYLMHLTRRPSIGFTLHPHPRPLVAPIISHRRFIINNFNNINFNNINNT
jgi:hypothetical protein